MENWVENFINVFDWLLIAVNDFDSSWAQFGHKFKWYIKLVITSYSIHYTKLYEDSGVSVQDRLTEGTERAREVAARKMKEVREAVGL